MSEQSTSDSMEENTDLSKYANFKYEGATPKLPTENHSLKKEQHLGDGAVSSVYELKGNKVLKLSNSLINVHSGEVIPSGMNPPLVENNPNESASVSREKVIAELLKYAKEKKQTYDLLKRYLGSHVTNIDVFAIVDSPLKEIYKLRYSLKDDLDALNVPVSELSVMEVGDKIDHQSELFNANFEFLEELYKNSFFQERAADFSKKAIELLQKERVMLDISDFNRVPIVNRQESGKYDDVVDLDGLLSLITNENQLPLYKNLAFHNQELQIFDSFPVFKISSDITDSDVEEALIAIQSRDKERIQEFFNKPTEKFKMISDEFIDDFIKMARNHEKTKAIKLFRVIYPEKTEDEIKNIVDLGIEELNRDYTDDEIRFNFVQMRAGEKFELLKYLYQLNFLLEKH